MRNQYNAHYIKKQRRQNNKQTVITNNNMDQKNYLKLELYPTHQEINVPIDEVETIVPFTDFICDIPVICVKMKNDTKYVARYVEQSTQKQQMTPGEIITFNNRYYQTWNLIIFMDSPLERVVHIAPFDLYPVLAADNLNYTFLDDDDMRKSPEAIAHTIENKYYQTEYAQYSELLYHDKEKTYGSAKIFKGTKHERKITFYPISVMYKWQRPFVPLHEDTNVFSVPDGDFSDYLIISRIEQQALKRYNIVLD